MTRWGANCDAANILIHCESNKYIQVGYAQSAALRRTCAASCCMCYLSHFGGNLSFFEIYCAMLKNVEKTLAFFNVFGAIRGQAAKANETKEAALIQDGSGKDVRTRAIGRDLCLGPSVAHRHVRLEELVILV